MSNQKAVSNRRPKSATGQSSGSISKARLDRGKALLNSNLRTTKRVVLYSKTRIRTDLIEYNASHCDRIFNSPRYHPVIHARRVTTNLTRVRSRGYFYKRRRPRRRDV
ncbi:hypothetical protein EVAR_86570_1 [Eumeta japonica]|uniref:Uncharacterized protein n=1 Tax=Eumeta variegata TaxID=151549 RepID=A0A4C2A596_EUMVA|nr:hypothetical protein EVAR_86570_1 [Eumeta japonica]